MFERSESEGSEKQNQVRQKSRAIVSRHSLGDEPSRLVRLETNRTSVDTIQEVVGESSHNSQADVFEAEVLPEAVNMSGKEQEFQYLEEEDYNRRKNHMDDAIKDVGENISSLTVDDVFEFTLTEAKDQLASDTFAKNSMLWRIQTGKSIGTMELKISLKKSRQIKDKF